MDRSALIVGLVLLAPIRASAQASCVDPTPADSAWWHWTMTPNGDGSTTGTAPDAPAQPPTFHLSTLAGRYAMHLVHTVGPDRGRSVEGTLEIAPSLEGSAKAPKGWPEYLSFAPDDPKDPTLRSVDAEFSATDRRLSLTIGNKGGRWTDAGVILEVFAVSDSVLNGRWVDGGLAVFGSSSGPHPQGWFCLVRS
jgi:hypothetical protein